jgi:hypothetical protein
MVIGQLSTVIQHHRSTLVLVNSGAVRSAMALVRDIVDGMYAGLWLDTCATAEQIQGIRATAEFPLHLLDMIKEVNEKYKEDAFFEDVKRRCGRPLYRSNRTGIYQLGRWALDRHAGLKQDEKEIDEVATTATLCILVLAKEFLRHQKHAVDAKAMQALAKELG